MWIIRIIDTKKFITMQLAIKNLILNNMIVIAQIAVLLVFNGIVVWIVQTILFIVIIIVNYDLFILIFNFSKVYIKR